MFRPMLSLSFLLLCLLMITGPTRSRTALGDKQLYYDSLKVLQGSHYSPAEVVDPAVDWPLCYGLQQSGLVEASFDCFGHFGVSYRPTGCTVPEWPLSSFVAPAGSDVEYLYGGAIWVGGIIGQDTLVSTGHDGWIGLREMYPSDQPWQFNVTRVHSPVADFSMRAEFTDTSATQGGYDAEDGNRPHLPLGLRIANRSHVWRTGPYDAVVVYDMVISNIGDQTIEDGYIGYYFDCDIGHSSDPTFFQDDLTGALREHGIAYIIDDDGDLPLEIYDQQAPRAFGFKFISSTFLPTDTNFNWWISNGSSSLDFGPRQKDRPGAPFRDFGTGGLGTPARDDNKYYVMSFAEWDYDQIYTASIQCDDTLWMCWPESLIQDFANGFDTRFLMSLGPLDLVPGQSERLLYATFTTDAVHTDPDNHLNLPNEPDTFLANLDFTTLIANGARADTLGWSLLNHDLPPIGLQVVYRDDVRIDVSWDPWCYDDIFANEVYLSKISFDSFPYPGVAPPWLRPVSLNSVAHLGPDVTSYSFYGLDPDLFYLVSVAHETDTGWGEASPPIIIKLGERGAPPQFEHEFVFTDAAQIATLTWAPPAQGVVDHYNIYRFDDSVTANQRYHAFYDSGYAAATTPPVDSFLVNGETYYYYAMDVYAEVSGGRTSFTDYGVPEGTIYVVTAVDEYGYESEFSIAVEVTEVPPRTQDVLVITHSMLTGPLFMVLDSVQAFYDSILAGYSYDIYDFGDTAGGYPTGVGSVDWHDFMRYRLVIVDDELHERALNDEYETTTKGYTRYVLSGGTLAYFGSFTGLEESVVLYWEPQFYPADHSFVQRFFGIDSVYRVGAGYFIENPVPFVDTLFGFNHAEAVLPEYPDLAFDTTRNPFSSFGQAVWPEGTPPSVAAFEPNSDGEVTHLYRALDGVSSPTEGLPVGVRSTKDSVKTFLFGFHLWYMDCIDARDLVVALAGEPGCCQNRGNVDGVIGMAGPVDVADLTYLIAYLYAGGPVPPCLDEGDVDGLSEGGFDITVADLTYLIDYLFAGGPEPPPC